MAPEHENHPNPEVTQDTEKSEESERHLGDVADELLLSLRPGVEKHEDGVIGFYIYEVPVASEEDKKQVMQQVVRSLKNAGFTVEDYMAGWRCESDGYKWDIFAMDSHTSQGQPSISWSFQGRPIVNNETKNASE